MSFLFVVGFAARQWDGHGPRLIRWRHQVGKQVLSVIMWGSANYLSKPMKQLDFRCYAGKILWGIRYFIVFWDLPPGPVWLLVQPILLMGKETRCPYCISGRVYSSSSPRVFCRNYPLLIEYLLGKSLIAESPGIRPIEFWAGPWSLWPVLDKSI